MKTIAQSETLIAKVVAPLKNDAMDKAEQFARAIIADVAKQLKEAGNDLEKCAPYPSSLNYGSRGEYMAKLAKYTLFHKLCRSRASSRSMHDPNFADMDSNYKAKYIKEAREDAAFQYEAFIIKLDKKVGPVSAALLEGNHVWGYSFLTVRIPSDAVQIWKTQHILNVSKLGKVFNQFPTRQVKNKK